MIRQEVASVIEKYYPNVFIDAVDITYTSKTVRLHIFYKIANSNIGNDVTFEFLRGGV